MKQKLEAERASKLKGKDASFLEADEAANAKRVRKLKAELEAKASFKTKSEQEAIARTAMKQKLEAERASKLKGKDIASFLEADEAANAKRVRKLKAELEAKASFKTKSEQEAIARTAMKQKLKAELEAKASFKAEQEAIKRGSVTEQ